jgi:hypothetical protein
MGRVMCMRGRPPDHVAVRVTRVLSSPAQSSRVLSRAPGQGDPGWRPPESASTARVSDRWSKRRTRPAEHSAFRDDMHKEMPTSRRARILAPFVRASLRARGFLCWPASPRALS